MTTNSTTNSHLASCDDPQDPSLDVAEATARILEAVRPLGGSECLALRSALGRVLAEDVISPIDVPSHTNSAMDGFALRGTDLDAAGGAQLRLAGEAFAGRAYPRAVGTGECVRIMTGAAMPAGTDTVVMQERAQVEGGQVRLAPGQRPGQNVRRAGEDLAQGGVALQAGHRLVPADLGLLASLGRAEVRVRRRPRVAFFSTGDELRSIGEPLGEGEVYDSNRYTLFGMLSRLGAEIRDLGVVRDDREALRSALAEAAADGDLVLTSGGVSVGEADYMKDVLAELGAPAFWKIAMKPGRPLTFGRIGEAWYFGLPGNPVAVMVTFYQFVQPALRRLAGEASVAAPTLAACAAERIRKRPGRTEFVRGVLSPGDRLPRVAKAGTQGSGVLRSMSIANCFIVLPPEQGDVAEGDLVAVQPFEGIV
ncbi:MAG: molybdopterin-binding protein [Gammaproteobacteria bacterium]